MITEGHIIFFQIKNMITCQQLAKIFKIEGFTFFTGVPCSILKYWLNYLDGNKYFKQITATSEGEACAIASGFHLATNRIPIVYMQNSGLGNSVDPLTSLINKEVYSIPLLLLISWRGEPGRKDEPQHIKMGRITKDLLKTLDIPFSVLPQNEKGIKKTIKKAKRYLKKKSLPYALILKKGTIVDYQIGKNKETSFLTRERAVELIVDNFGGKEIIVSTTGKTSRELFDLRETRRQNHKADFYVLGSMGCATGIALGIALQKPKKRVFVFDGDGAVLMKMGTLATVGHYLPKNFCHIVFDNNAHESTGGQKTVSDTADFSKIAKACGYRFAKVVFKEKDIKDSLSKIKKGPTMLVIKVKKGSRETLGRPTISPLKMKKSFKKFIAH